MQLIAVDIGNSSMRVALAGDDGSDWLWEETIATGSDMGRLKLGSQASYCWSVCSVHQQRFFELSEWVANSRPQDLFWPIKDADVPLPSDVNSRESIGRDRLVAAYAAFKFARKGPVVIVDAGTAVTIDLVSDRGVFEGGLIYPGTLTALKSLNQNTDALPDLSAIQLDQHRKVDLRSIGKSTIDAILNGVNQSQVAAMTGIVERLNQEYQKAAPVFVTGGAIPAIRSSLPAEWMFVPDLVLLGAKLIGQDKIENQVSECQD